MIPLVWFLAIRSLTEEEANRKNGAFPLNTAY